MAHSVSEFLEPVQGNPVESISWTPGTTEPIDLETYDDKLDILPPRWMNGHTFAFGEGAGPFSIFWKASNRYFVTHLTDEQTKEFCRLTGARLYQ